MCIRDRDKIRAIQEFRKPKNLKQLKGFLGLTNFYNRFTNKCTEATQSLLNLLKKDTTFKWTKEMDQHFERVKELFIESVILKHPDPSKRFYLQTDASRYALGGQLYQLDENNDIGVVAFTSRVVRGAERNYFTTELELLSVVHCLQKFRTYVLGKPLTIITDNKALIFIKKCHLNNSRITRWILAIQEYDFDIIHCKGRDNIMADILSRHPEDMDKEESIDQTEELEINLINIRISKEAKEQLKNIKGYQLADTKLKRIIDLIQANKQHKLAQKYIWHNEKLYRKEKGIWKLMLTEELCRNMIYELHQAYSHVGNRRTYHLVKENFTGDSINKIMKLITRTCQTCQKSKDHFKRMVGETQPVIPKNKSELISIDYYGPLPVSTGKVRYILTMIDNFTKYVKLRCV